ncbi:MAG TPA: hypothetical protein VE402_07460, partial [Candidatus Angelobacter sp.]|nr:hypothetical protein [Candidatus Angelobacter sp.]
MKRVLPLVLVLFLIAPSAPDSTKAKAMKKPASATAMKKPASATAAAAKDPLAPVTSRGNAAEKRFSAVVSEYARGL